LSARGVHAIALDLPGFGGSRDVPGPYTIQALADAVADFIHAHKLGAVTLVGNSMGSTVAQFTALRHPEVVRRLVLTAAGAYVSIPLERRLPPERAREFWATRDIKAMVDGFFYKQQPPAGHAENFYAVGRQMNLEAAIEANQSNLEWSTLEDLHKIQVPTLIVEGSHDPTRSPKQGELMVSRLPNARLVVQQNSAHSPQWDEPEVFRAAVLPFILDGQKETTPGAKR
jgi:pimeloyl-ACP methyl ester carboxylesterase